MPGLKENAPRAIDHACRVCGKPTKGKSAYCGQTCRKLASKTRKAKDAWYSLQLEVAVPMVGRLMGGREGRFADVETTWHLVECKYTEYEKFEPEWVTKIVELAARYRKFPVLVLGFPLGRFGGRAAFFLDTDQELINESLRRFRPVLRKWHNDLRDVWVSAYNLEGMVDLPGGPLEKIPGLGSLVGRRLLGGFDEQEYEEQSNDNNLR